MFRTVRNTLFILGGLLTCVVSSHAQNYHQDVDDLWEDEPIVDGLLEPGSRSGDYSDLTAATGARVIVGKLVGACEIAHCANSGYQFPQHEARYQSRKDDGVNFVKTARELSCKRIYNDEPEFVIYQQKIWRLDFLADASDAQNEAAMNTRAQAMFNSGLRIVQLEYSPGANNDYYEVGEHFAGAQTGGTDIGFTKHGLTLAKWGVTHGMILDVSHSRNETVNDALELSATYSARRNRAVPVFANHTGIDSSSWKRHNRNKTLDEMCRVAATGGIIGVIPLKTWGGVTTFVELIEVFDEIKNYTCSITDWRGQTINMIDHLSVASDSGLNYYDDSSDHYIDPDAARQDRWKWLANQMRTRSSDAYTNSELKKIFSSNQIRALRAGLEGQLPFEPNFCSFPDGGDVHVGDWNSDGRSDMMFHGSNGKTWTDLAERGGEFEGVNWKSGGNTWCQVGSKRKLYIGDFNGDGADDMLCHQSNGKSWIDYADSEGHFDGTDWSSAKSSKDKSWCNIGDARELLIGDFNNDGRDDLFCHQANGKSWIDYAGSDNKNIFNGTDWSRSKSSSDKSWCNISVNRKLLIGDFNKDGRDDLLCHQSNGKSWIDYAGSDKKNVFNGTDWSRTKSSQDKSWCSINSQISLHVADANGDGRDDLVCHSKNSGTVYLDLADSEGHFNGSDWSKDRNFCTKISQSIHVGDVNKDNRADLLCYEEYDGWLTMMLGKDNGFETELRQ